MLGLQRQIEDCWKEITGDPVYQNEDGSSRKMRFIRLGFGDKGAIGREGSDYPFFATRISSGEDLPSAGSLTVIIVIGLYCHPDQDGDGVYSEADIAQSQQVLFEIVSQLRKLGGNGNYSPYSLERIRWQFGDEDGSHPSPDHYIVAAELLFSGESALNNFI